LGIFLYKGGSSSDLYIEVAEVQPGYETRMSKHREGSVCDSSWCLGSSSSGVGISTNTWTHFRTAFHPGGNIDQWINNTKAFNNYDTNVDNVDFLRFYNDSNDRAYYDEFFIRKYMK